MHSITLDAAASALLLSGIVCLGLLFKRTPSSRLGSSASVLSISDLSSSLLTSLVLLLHRFYLDSDLGPSLEPSLGPIAADDEGSAGLVRDASSTAAQEQQAGCDFRAVFFQYAVFLVPFANAFVSLLGFSASCHAAVSGIERRCSRLGLGQQPGRTSLAESLPAGGRLYGAGLAVLGQWLLPALFSGVFQLAEHRRIELANRTMDELVCTLAANFPLENCAEELQLSAPPSPSVDPLGSPTSLHDYVVSEDNLLWPSPNSSETLELVARIHALVRAALNDSSPPQRLRYNAGAWARPRALPDGLQVLRCARDRCVVSERFLQVHLFLFLSLAYFAPILASALLLVASHYKCREIGRKLGESNRPEPQGEDAQAAQAARELSCETERMQSFYRLFRVSVLLAVALWTPFFLQVVSKSFFCSNVPGWLTELAFLATIVFGVFRNALNLAVAKIDAEAEDTKKPNSVHPN